MIRKRKARKAAARSDELLWMRLGDNGEYEEYGQDFDAAVMPLVELNLTGILRWSRHGFDATEFLDVSLFWGDKEAQLVRDLNKRERKEFEEALKRAVEDYGRKQ